MIWEKLYEIAKKQYNPHDLSPFFYSNHVACAIEAEDGQIFHGFCIEGASGVLNLCAERIAAINMIVNSSQTVIKRILVMRDKPPYVDGNFLPCGACREYMMQLDKESGEIEILTNLKEMKTVRLKELIPDWWGRERFNI